ncbi:MAG TPA: hypothetical protein VFU63_01220 [Ktedonobacterales bacterium]|nr:hypothetical protein [Ktedonobacterales bacterium]
MDEQNKKQRGGWFKRNGHNTAAPTPSQPGNSGKFAQTMSAWARSIQERRDNANRTRDLANKLTNELAAILRMCSEQEKALGQRSMRTQVQLSMALGRLSGIAHQLEATRTVCAYLLETTQPQLPVVAATVAGANGSYATATLAAPASPSRPLFAGGNSNGPLAAPVVRELGRGGFRRMARDLQRAFHETAQASQDILRPIQTQGSGIPDVNALASALAALEPLMTWLNQRCETLTATYCATPTNQL